MGNLHGERHDKDEEIVKLKSDVIKLEEENLQLKKLVFNIKEKLEKYL